MLNEPLAPTASKPLVRQILDCGNYVVSKHGRTELAKDDMSDLDVVNILRAGVYEHGEYENGSWRYRVHTHLMTVVICFRSESELVVVTGWRSRR